ncbi:unnamed protein product [Rhizophagus irregularis]|nr:unnamed protein product [Rhizophagus irregularis]
MGDDVFRQSKKSMSSEGKKVRTSSEEYSDIQSNSNILCFAMLSLTCSNVSSQNSKWNWCLLLFYCIADMKACGKLRPCLVKSSAR